MKTIKQTIIENLQTIYNAEIISQFEYDSRGDYVEVFTKEVLFKFNHLNIICYLWVGQNGKMVWSVTNCRKTARPVFGNIAVELKTQKN